ncbi:(3R)-hydroxymyristoyl-[acyl-carrier-protein] dehydratase [Candidatus Westeberhardia cardiocondylae]|uniref:3-hydroxyacyl-[acyl-carrier-protein] dehydratase FabZ n=1 Tax=Candidatus Westeberhardia cardiocondylae TaxID=1594731 RepID=A0A0H5BX30_9ENTR|nr:3-hydroxyacyl-ACP dehydratase FabZ [Candidatus Westeberhardia cardiocondylae]CEN32292.1 (3R)-hydroxymyristoyl-[acyl-carrier-protein] dehydratase [Candidatus Westeberhardia cardiocondylae]
MTIKIHKLYAEEILKFLPHRFPFLLIDRVLNFTKGRYLCAIKNVTFNEPFFQGHFPKKPIFPGVLILEAMAQASGILALKSEIKLLPEEYYYLAAINEAQFKQTVQPGDQIIFEIKFVKKRKKITKFNGIAKVDGKITCQASLMCTKQIKK